MNLLLTQKEDLIEIADTIREKNNITDKLSFPNQFIEQIKNINTNSLDWLTELLGGERVIKSEGSINENNHLLEFNCHEAISTDSVKFAFLISNNYIQGISLTIPEVLANLSPMSLLIYINFNGIQCNVIRTNNDKVGVLRYSNFWIEKGLSLCLSNDLQASVYEIDNSHSSNETGYITYDNCGYTGYFII